MCRRLRVLAITAAFAWAAAAAGSPGVLDPSFGASGLAEAPRGAAPVVQPDGRILTGGSNGDLAVVMRLDTRGRPDATFGAAGVAYVPLATGFAKTLSIALQPDGKIVAAGETYTAFREHGMVFVARFNPDGSVDPSFGDGGSASGSIVPATPPDGNIVYPDSIGYVGVAVARDGAIFLAAYALRTLGNPVATLVRLDRNGTRDVSFGQPLEDFSRSVRLQSITGPVVQADGKAVMAGRYYLLSGGTGIPTDFAFRLRADGRADPSFGFEGQANVPVQPSQVMLDGDGRLLVASTQSGPPQLEVARLAANGSIDHAFGGDGVAIASVGPCGRFSAHFDPCPRGATSIALQPDGKIVATGASVDPIAATAIVRFDVDGKLDTTFGVDGRAYATLTSGGEASAIDAEGARLYVASFAGSCCGDALSRFLLSPVPVTLDASANPATAGGPVTLTATVADAVLGLISFYDATGAIAGCANVAVAPGNGARATCTTTFADGTHSVAAAYLDIAGKSRGASDPLVLSAGDWPAASVAEFHYAAAGDYFMTSDSAEAATLDATPGWQRTGQAFRAFPSSAPGTRAMCRYYTSPGASPQTHFFGANAAECSLGYPWRYEVDTIAVMTPAANGSCASGTLPLYRMLDPRGAAHRYATSVAVRESMLSQGWIAEGFGVGVVACMAR